jgi:PAS domain S-box-containing protein
MRRREALFPSLSVRLGSWLGVSVVLAICAVDLVGWLLGLPLLTSIISAWTPMRVVTALCMGTSASALVLVLRVSSSTGRSRVAQILGAVVGLIALLTLVSYVRLMSTGVPASWAEVPVLDLFLAPVRRMALVTAFLLLTTGVAVVLLAAGGRRSAGVAHALLLPAAVVSYLVPVSYLLGVQAIHEWFDVPVAMNTGIAFCALCFAMFCARVDTWLMSAFTGNQAGGAMTRRLLPALLPLPVLIGWLRLYGEHTGVFQSDVGVVFVAITYTVCLVTIVWLTARSLDRTDEMRKAAERELGMSQRRLATTLASIGDAVMAADRDGRIAFMNPVAEALTGWTSKEAFGRPLPEIFHIINEESRLPADDPVARVFREKRVVGLANHTILVRKDGTEVAIDDSGAPIRDEGGNVIGAVLVFRDISERRQTEEALRLSEEKFALAFANNPAAIALTRLDDGLFLEVNDTWAAMTGYRRDEAIGHSARQMNIWPSQEDAASFVKELLQNGSLRGHEQAFHKKSGEIYVAQLSAQILPIQGETLILSTLVDITDRKRAEEKIKQLNADLETRVVERTAEAERRAEQLRALATEVIRAEERERRRLAQVLHDGLQQLLVAAKMRVGLARTGAKGQEQIEKALNEVTDLLMQSIESSRSLTAELSPPALYDAGLPEALGWLARWMEEKHGLEVDVRTDGNTDTSSLESRVLLFQGARELLFNVAKHAGVERVSMALLRAGPNIRLEIVDSGQGFDPAERRPGAYSGGFGLFSLRERLEPLGGHMFVDSTPGVGTCVALEIPDATAIESPPAEAHQDGTRMPVRPAGSLVSETAIRVLLVDDHAIVRQGLAGMIAGENGIEVVGEAGDGLEAVAMARKLQPDTIIMDVNMPRMNGLEATQAITAEMPEIKVIGLSVHDCNDMETKMREAGAWAYMDKSGPGEDLIAAIRASREG